MNNLPIIYNQTTTSRTYSLCKNFYDSQNNVPYLIKILHDTLFKTRIYDASNVYLKPRAKKAKILYTYENIEANTLQGDTLLRFSRKDIVVADALYRDTVKIIIQFFKTKQPTNYEGFCLFYFLGCISSHLSESRHRASENYGKALECLSACAFTQERKFQEIDVFKVYRRVEHRLLKHQALPYLSLVDTYHFPISSAEALSAKTYICRRLCRVIHPISCILPQTQSIFCIKDINVPKILENLSVTRFSKLVLKLNALDSIHHSRFKIIFSETINSSSSIATGHYNNRNTIRVDINAVGHDNILFHELTHKTMERIFNNFCNPYFKNDNSAKIAYRKAMKQVLINLICCISPALKSNNYTATELVHEYFSRNSTFILSHSKSVNELYVWALYERLQTVFASYSISELDREFITNATQFINEAGTYSKYFEILKPLMDFIDTHVIPEIEQYIANHPCRNQIIDA